MYIAIDERISKLSRTKTIVAEATCIPSSTFGARAKAFPASSYRQATQHSISLSDRTSTSTCWLCICQIGSFLLWHRWLPSCSRPSLFSSRRFFHKLSQQYSQTQNKESKYHTKDSKKGQSCILFEKELVSSLLDIGIYFVCHDARSPSRLSQIKSSHMQD
jgi:hypothetical protein